MKAENNEKLLLQGLARNDRKAIETIYKENYNMVQSLVVNNNGTADDAGDIFQGTPYFNFYGGELEFKLMSKMRYDAATIGNHDFDNGIDGLLAQLPHAQFDLLSANYDFSNTILEGQTKPYKVFVKDGVRIGVFGLGIELEGLVGKKLYRETQYLDPVGVAQDTVAKLKQEEHCDLVICLSHLGYQYRHDKISDLPGLPSWTGIIQREVATPTGPRKMLDVVADRFRISSAERSRVVELQYIHGLISVRLLQTEQKTIFSLTSRRASTSTRTPKS